MRKLLFNHLTTDWFILFWPLFILLYFVVMKNVISQNNIHYFVHIEKKNVTIKGLYFNGSFHNLSNLDIYYCSPLESMMLLVVFSTLKMVLFHSAKTVNLRFFSIKQYKFTFKPCHIIAHFT